MATIRFVTFSHMIVNKLTSFDGRRSTFTNHEDATRCKNKQYITGTCNGPLHTNYCSGFWYSAFLLQVSIVVVVIVNVVVVVVVIVEFVALELLL